MLDATPSPSGGSSRVSTPPVATTPDVVVPGLSAGVPSPAASDTVEPGSDDGPTAAKRPRLRSTKSELFLVSSEPSRDATDSDGSCNVSARTGGNVGPPVTAVVTTLSDDSLDSSCVADVSQNSITTEETARQTSASSVINDHSTPPTDGESSSVEVCQ